MKYTLAQLEALPTIKQGHTDDLKIESGNGRVWLSRMTIEDGQPYNNQVTIERFNDAKGRWETVTSYEAK